MPVKSELVPEIDPEVYVGFASLGPAQTYRVMLSRATQEALMNVASIVQNAASFPKFVVKASSEGNYLQFECCPGGP